jgi:hypothetical protein
MNELQMNPYYKDYLNITKYAIKIKYLLFSNNIHD